MEPFQGGEVVWAPSAADLQRSEMARFVRACGLDDYADLLSRADAETVRLDVMRNKAHKRLEIETGRKTVTRPN